MPRMGNKKLRRTTVGVLRHFYQSNVRVRSGDLDIHCIHAFFALFGFKSDSVPFADFVNQAADVDENFLPGGSVNNETKTFGLIEELDGSFKHYCKNFKNEKNLAEATAKIGEIGNWKLEFFLSTNNFQFR